uniref:Uncharacterized protein n=1 Tax=Coturnix japonica TaxID=93934 RepID=A0A8C2SR62_COTJA
MSIYGVLWPSMGSMGSRLMLPLLGKGAQTRLLGPRERGRTPNREHHGGPLWGHGTPLTLLGFSSLWQTQWQCDWAGARWTLSAGWTGHVAFKWRSRRWERRFY